MRHGRSFTYNSILDKEVVRAFVSFFHGDQGKMPMTCTGRQINVEAVDGK